jgi:hypothetical protein
MPKTSPGGRTTIAVPEVSGEEAAQATDLVQSLVDRYGISTTDVDGLFNAMVAVYIRARMVHGDRQPTFCSLITCAPSDSDSRDN